MRKIKFWPDWFALIVLKCQMNFSNCSTNRKKYFLRSASSSMKLKRENIIKVKQENKEKLIFKRKDIAQRENELTLKRGRASQDWETGRLLPVFCLLSSSSHHIFFQRFRDLPAENERIHENCLACSNFIGEFLYQIDLLSKVFKVCWQCRFNIYLNVPHIDANAHFFHPISAHPRLFSPPFASQPDPRDTLAWHYRQRRHWNFMSFIFYMFYFTCSSKFIFSPNVTPKYFLFLGIQFFVFKFYGRQVFRLF